MVPEWINLKAFLLVKCFGKSRPISVLTEQNQSLYNKESVARLFKWHFSSCQRWISGKFWCLGTYSETVMLRRLNNLGTFFSSDLPGEVFWFNWEDEYYTEKQREWCVILTKMGNFLLWVRRDIVCNPCVPGVFVAFRFMLFCLNSHVWSENYSTIYIFQNNVIYFGKDLNCPNHPKGWCYPFITCEGLRQERGV